MLHRSLALKEQLEDPEKDEVHSSEGSLTKTEGARMLFFLCQQVSEEISTDCATIIFNPIVRKDEQFFRVNASVGVTAENIKSKTIDNTEAAIRKLKLEVHSASKPNTSQERVVSTSVVSEAEAYLFEGKKPLTEDRPQITENGAVTSDGIRRTEAAIAELEAYIKEKA